MVNFDPRIDYSKEASKTFDEYRNMKKEEQQKEKERLSEPICYARLKFDSLTEDMEERVKEFHKENKEKLWSEGVVTRGYSDSYLGWRSQGFFLPKSLIDFLALNPK